jgi:hypothetical protein
MRGVDDIGHEGRGRAVLDEVRAARIRGAADDRFHERSSIRETNMAPAGAATRLVPGAASLRRLPFEIAEM